MIGIFMSKPSKLYQDLQTAIRDLEIQFAKFDIHHFYEVFETDATLKPGKLIYQGFSLDVAETTMTHRFIANSCDKDYILYNHNTNTPLALLLSDNSKKCRKELNLKDGEF